MTTILPIVDLLRSYRREWLAGDLRGGISASLVMIPSVVAYAQLARLAPEYGLYAALLGMLGYALFASSRHVIAGPDAAITLLVAAGVGPLAAGDPVRTVALSSATALLGGAMMLLATRLRAGVVADFLSKPVLLGYMSGAALILVSTQLGMMLGIGLEQDNVVARVVELGGKLDQAHGLTLGLGLGFLALLAVSRRLLPRLPGALVVVVVGLLLSALLDLERRGVQVVGMVPGGLPHPRLPAVSMADLTLLLPSALGIALLSFPDGILLARAFAAREGYDIRPNQELTALAVSNLASGLFQGFSVGASQSRTTVSQDAGGRTQMASLVSAAILALFLLFFTQSLRLLPTVALGSILVYSGLHLIDIPAYRRLRRISWRGYAIALLVAAGVLVVGVVPGILVGVGLSLFYVLGRLARPAGAVLREVPGTGTFHDVGDATARESLPGLIAYRFYAPLFFANAGHFMERVRGLLAASPVKVRWFLLDAQAITDVDVTGAEALCRLIEELRNQGIEFKLARANRPLRETMAHIGFREQLGETTLFPSVHAAIAEFRRTVAPIA